MWTKCGYAVLEEMSSRGSAIAKMYCEELKQLDDLLDQLPSKYDMEPAVAPVMRECLDTPTVEKTMDEGAAADVFAYPSHTTSDSWMEDFAADFELSAEQLICLADSLNVVGLT